MSDLYERKLAELEAASQNKQTQLYDAAAAQYQHLMPSGVQDMNTADTFAGRAAKNFPSVVGVDSPLYKALNTGAAFVQGTAEVMGNAAALPNTTAGAARLRNMAPGVQEAYGRKQAGNATAEDEALLALPRGMETADPASMTPYQRRMLANQARAVEGGFGQGQIETNEQALAKGQQNLTTATNVKDSFDYKGQVDNVKSSGLEADLRKANSVSLNRIADGITDFTTAPVSKTADVLMGIGGLATNWLGAGASNPAATIELLAQNAPQLIAAATGGGLGMAATNAPYAADTFREGLVNFAKNNDGRAPTAEEIDTMAIKAASLAAAETAGDMLTLGAGRVAGAFGKSTEELAAAALKKLGTVGKVATSAPGKVLGAAYGEAITEGYQTAMEGDIKGERVTVPDVLLGAGLGALVGGATHGGLALASGGPAGAKDAAARLARANEDRKAVQAAVAGKNPDAFLDRDSNNYRPDMAVQVLKSMNTDAKVTPAEQQANLERARSIGEAMDADLATHTRAEGFRADPEKKAERVAALNEMIAEHDSVYTAEDAKDPANAEDFKVYEEAKREVAMLNAPDAQFNRSKKNAQGRVDETAKVMARFNRDEATKTDFATEADVVDKAQPGSAEADTASRKILNLAMSTPERIDTAKVESLASNESNGLSAKDRSYLQKWVAARKASEGLKGFDGVSNDILKGNKAEGFLGLEQHRNEISQAINEGSFSKAAESAGKFQSFVNNHAAKTAAVQEAYAAAKTDGLNHYPVKQEDGTWTVEDTPPAAGKAGTDFFNIHRGSNKNGFISRMEGESAALRTTYDELRAAYQLRKNGSNPLASDAVKDATLPEASVDPRGQPTPVTVPAKASENSPQAPTSPTPVQSAPTPVAPEQAGSNGTVGLEQPSPVAVATPSAAQATPASQAARATAPTPQPTQDRGVKDPDERVPTKEVAQQPREESTTREKDLSNDPVNTEDNKAPTPIDVDPAAGKLSIFDKAIPTTAGQKVANLFRSANRIAQYMTQSGNKPGSDSVKPLASVKDFLSQWTEGKAFPEQMLKDGIKTDTQRRAIDNLYNTLQAWNPLVMGNYVVKPRNEQFTTDMFQEFYIDGKPVTDENVATAISAAAYSWVNDAGYDAAYKTVGEVFDMHGINSSNEYMPHYELMRAMQNHTHTLHQELGKAAVQALGLKAKKNAPQDLMPKLEAALGMRAAALLQDVGAIKFKAIPVKTVNEALGTSTGRESANAKNGYYYINRNKNLSLPKVMRDIVDANKHSGDIVNKLFDTDKPAMFASTEPKPFNQAKAKKTNQDVPKKLQRVLEKAQSTPIKAIPAMMSMFKALGTDNIVVAAGGRDPAVAHVRDRDSAEAKREGLYREVEIMDTMLNDPNLPNGLDTEFYVEHEVWKNFRVGIKTKSLNQQSSKIHRFAFAQPGWEVTIDPQNQAQVDKFLIGFAQNSGLVKTDTQTNAQTLEKLAAAVQRPAFKAAIEATQAMLRGSKDGDVAKLTPAQQEAIASFAAAQEGMMTLQSLVAYAQYLEAGTAPFKTTMLVGADGKTNGPMLTMLALGIGDPATLAMGGMYPVGTDQPGHFSQWYSESPEAQDFYQRTAKNALDNVYKTGDKRMIQAVEVVTGNLVEDSKVTSAGRNIIKTPLTAFFFGSALKNSIESMADSFIDSTYAKIAKIKAEPDAVKQAEQTKAMVQALNTLHGRNVLPLDTTIDTLFNKTLDHNNISEDGIKAAFIETIGKPTAASMKNDFRSFIGFRKAFSAATNASFAAYEITYNALRARELNRLMKAGEIETRETKDGQQVPLHDMTAAQEAAFKDSIKDILPIMHSAYSKEDRNLGAGIYMAKSKTASSDNPMYEARGQFKNSYGNTGLKGSATSISSDTSQRVDAAPGAMGLPGSIHSSDSFAMHSAMDTNVNSLSIHDEGANSVDNIDALAGDLNKAVFDTFLNYSPMGEANRMLERIVVGLAERIREGVVPPSAAFAVGRAWAQMSNYDGMPITDAQAIQALTNIPKTTDQFAAIGDIARLKTLSEMGVIDQYTWEGGQYQVTDADRAKAKKAYDEAVKNKEQNAAVAEAVEYLTQVAEGNPAADLTAWIQRLENESLDVEVDPNPTNVESAADLGITEAVAAPIVTAIAENLPVAKPVQEALQRGEDLAKAVEALPEVEQLQVAGAISSAAAQTPQTLFNEWGEIGTPLNSDPYLVSRMDAKPVMGKADIIKTLYNAIKNQPQNNVAQFQMELLKMLNKALSPDVTVNYIHSTTPHNGQTVLKNSRGWFTNQDNQIYVLSTDYVNSQVSPEVFLHELTHSALANAVQQAMDNPSKANPEAVELVKNLQALQAKAKQYAVDNNLAATYSDPLTNIHEFISWGMTNTGFQRDVLSKFNTKASYTGNSLVSGMKAVIAAFRNFLFRASGRSSQAVTANALMVMVTNVSGLMADAAARNTNLKIIAREAGMVAGAAPEAKADINLAMTVNDPAAGVQAKTIEDVFGRVLAAETSPRSEAFNEQLADLVTRTSSKILGTFGTARADMMRDAARTPEDVFLAMQQDAGWVEPNTFAVGLPFNQTETFVANQVQAAVSAATGRKEAPAMVGMREFQKLYNDTMAQLTPEMFLEAANGDAMLAAAIHNSISDVNSPDYLARFAALALGNEAFNKVLSKLETTKKDPSDTILGKIGDLFSTVLDWITGKLTKSNPDDKTSVRVNDLVNYMMHTEQKLRNKEIDKATKSAPILDSVFDTANETISKTLRNIGDSSLFQASKSQVFNFAGASIGILGGSARATHLLTGIQALRNSTFKEREGFIASQVTDLAGPGQTMEGLLRMAKNNERERMQAQAGIGAALLKGFKRKDFTPAEHRGITNTVLRTDMQSLLDTHSQADMVKLVADPTYLASEQARLVAAIPKSNYSNFMVDSAKALGFYMATGKVTTEHLLFNAHNIARLGGTADQGKVSEAAATALQPTIDALATLYAIQYTSAADKAAALKVMREEGGRGKENGIELLTRVHNGMVKDSKNNLFQDSAEALMMKGWAPEITNPNISVVVAHGNDGALLEKQGWVKVTEPMAKDPADTNTDKKTLYTRADGGMPAQETGLMAYTGLQAKGAEMSFDNSNEVKKTQANKAVRPTTYSGTFDPTKAKGAYMAPVLNESGDVVNYRYMMSANMRDNLLQRDNRFDKIMGSFGASIINKSTTPVQNGTMVDALFEQYEADRKKVLGSDAYIEVGPNSKDPEIQENWAMLPESTRRYVNEVWGTNSMMIRADQFNLVFGSRMPSVANLFTMDPKDRNFVQTALASVVEAMVFGGTYIGTAGDYTKARDVATYQSGYRARQVEAGWQELMKEIKSNIVIKNISVFLGNVSSNVTLLKLAGVPILDIVKYHRIAYVAAEAYTKDNNRKIELEQMIDNGYFPEGEVKMRRELTRVNDALNRNPAKKLMDAGLMPTIVEDIDTSNEIYSYKSQLASKVEGVTGATPSGIREVGKQIYATRDSWYFQKMNRATQLSDFVARYTLIEHVMNRKINPLSEADAMHYASEAFINYDIPSNRYMNYANSVGLVMFTKYYMRIQRMIVFLFKEHPAEALTLSLAHNYVNGMESILDSFFLGRLGNNPFNVGVLNYYDSVKNILPIKLLTAPLR